MEFTITTTLALFLALAPAVVPSRAPAVLTARTETQEQDLREDAVQWNGVREKDGAFVPLLPETRAGETRERLLAELEEARLAAKVDRELERAMQTLNELRIRASWAAGFEGQWDVLKEIALARADLLQTMGDVEGARLALRHLLPSAADIPTEGELSHVRPAPPGTEVRARKALDDERIVSFQLELAVREEPVAQESGGGIEETVRHALVSGNNYVLRQLGERAIPVLSAIALENPNAISTHASWANASRYDPLYNLVLLDKAAAIRFFRRNLDRGGELWKKRMLWSVSSSDTLDTPAAWIAVSGEDQRACAFPEALFFLAECLREPSVAPLALEPIEEGVLQWGPLDEALQGALGEIVAGEDVSLARQALAVFEQDYRIESAHPVYVRGLESSDPIVRRRCASYLAQFQGTELLPLADSEDPVLRGIVAGWLAGTPYRVPTFSTNELTAGPHKFALPPRTPAVLEVMAKLARDPEPEIRESIARALDMSEGQVLPDEVYLALASDSSVDTRARIVGIEDLPWDLRRRILELAAQDPNASIVKVFDDSWTKIDQPAGLERFLPLLKLRFARRAELPLPSRYDFYNLAVRSAATLNGLLDIAHEIGDQSLRDSLYYHVHKGVDQNMYAEVARLDPRNLARFFVYASTSSAEWFGDLLAGLRNEIQPPRYEAMSLVVNDTDLHPLTRLFAAGVLARGGGADVEESILDCLSALDRPDVRGVHGLHEQLRSLVSFLPAEMRGDLRLRVARDESLPDFVCAALLEDYDPYGEHGEAITRIVLERWFDPEDAFFWPVNVALRHLATLEVENRAEILARAARMPETSLAAIRTIGKLRDPRLLPVLGDSLAGDVRPSDANSKAVPAAAVEALTAYLSDAAAEQLLRGAGWDDETVREMCLEGLATIRRYQEERRAWEERGLRIPTRADAVAELFHLLQDGGDLERAEAAKGLALLDAVEAIPALIRMLGDSQEAVRAGAREALDLLRTRASERTKEAPTTQQE